MSKATRWTGRILTGLPVLFLLMDTGIKLANLPIVTETMNQLGYRPELTPAIAILQVACLALYLIPATAPLGAVLITGFLGGAVATHVRVGNPLFSHVLFPTYVAAMLWGGLFLRDERLRVLIPGRRRVAA
jgi:hypothetical protein